MPGASAPAPVVGFVLANEKRIAGKADFISLNDEQLAKAKGSDFDRLFLEYMIRHHEGALTMVSELFSTPGAGQESEIFAFVSDVVADQRMEIDRMGAMLKELQK